MSDDQEKVQEMLSGIPQTLGLLLDSDQLLRMLINRMDHTSAPATGTYDRADSTAYSNWTAYVWMEYSDLYRWRLDNKMLSAEELEIHHQLAEEYAAALASGDPTVSEYEDPRFPHGTWFKVIVRDVTWGIDLTIWERSPLFRVHPDKRAEARLTNQWTQVLSGYKDRESNWFNVLYQNDPALVQSQLINLQILTKWVVRLLSEGAWQSRPPRTFLAEDEAEERSCSIRGGTP